MLIKTDIIRMVYIVNICVPCCVSCVVTPCQLLLLSNVGNKILKYDDKSTFYTLEDINVEINMVKCMPCL